MKKMTPWHCSFLNLYTKKAMALEELDKIIKDGNLDGLNDNSCACDIVFHSELNVSIIRYLIR